MRLSLFPLIVICLCSCQTIPEILPVSDQAWWRFDADMTSRQSATISKGQTRAEVVAELGEPRSARRFTEHSNIEVLTYVRNVSGPLRIKQVSTRSQIMTVRAPVYYLDTIQVYLDGGLVAVVAFKRETDNEPYSGARHSLP